VALYLWLVGGTLLIVLFLELMSTVLRLCQTLCRCSRADDLDDDDRDSWQRGEDFDREFLDGKRSWGQKGRERQYFVVPVDVVMANEEAVAQLDRQFRQTLLLLRWGLALIHVVPVVSVLAVNLLNYSYIEITGRHVRYLRKIDCDMIESRYVTTCELRSA
jgi:hypothetical protein